MSMKVPSLKSHRLAGRHVRDRQQTLPVNWRNRRIRK
jgi:hypothetical protein